MQWVRVYSHVKSIQHNETLYTYLLNLIVEKLKKEGIEYTSKAFKDLHPLPYEEYKLEVEFLLLRIAEYYTPFKGRPDEDISRLKRRLLGIIMDMQLAYGVLNK